LYLADKVSPPWTASSATFSYISKWNSKTSLKSVLFVLFAIDDIKWRRDSFIDFLNWSIFSTSDGSSRCLNTCWEIELRAGYLCSHVFECVTFYGDFFLSHGSSKIHLHFIYEFWIKLSFAMLWFWTEPFLNAESCGEFQLSEIRIKFNHHL
jgi:hypothetical protein